MANEVWKISQSSITAQASAAISADTFSGGAQTTLSQAGSSGNAEGAFLADIYADVTAAPSGGDCTLELWMEASLNNSDFSAAEYSLTVQVPDGDSGDFHLGVIELPPYSKLKLKAVDYGLTAVLYAIPQLPEVQ